MPTRYWLVDPELNLRSRGSRPRVACAPRRPRSTPRRCGRPTLAYAAERDAAIPPDHTGPRPSGGVGGTRTGVKCLHAHYAYLLAGGDDPVGRWTAVQLASDFPEPAWASR